MDINVGALIITTGPRVRCEINGQYGFGQYANVVTNLQMERLIAMRDPPAASCSGPRTVTLRRIAILQCVGSRDTERDYCSEVCCMYALKEGQMMRDRYPEAKVSIFYMDVRAFGKGYYRYQFQTQQKGVKLIRTRVSRIRENPKTKNLFLLARAEDGKSISAEFDIVVLSVAQCQSPEPGRAKTHAGHQDERVRVHRKPLFPYDA